MAVVTYFRGGEAASPERMNALIGAFAGKMEKILGGRSFVLAFNMGVVQPPPILFGQCFFLTSGVAAYTAKLPGYIAQDISVQDPLTGAMVAGVGARAYDHAAFSASAALPIVESIGDIAYLGDVPQAAYPPGITKLNGISIFENSLEAYTREWQSTTDVAPRTYWLAEKRRADGEGGGVYPSKIYDYALADIFIEGLETASLQVCALNRFKFKNLRIHNLQAVSCTLTLPDGAAVALQPYECRSFRLNVAGTAFVESPYRYFQQYRNYDPRLFWYWNSNPSFIESSAISAGAVLAATGGMQANNLSNPCIIYDFIQYLRVNDATRFAWFNVDVHELCDIYDLEPSYRAKFGDPSNPGTRLGDLMHHKGALEIARTVKVDNNPDLNVPRTTWDTLEFNGYETIVADFAAKGITVAPNADGNLVITKNDSEYDYDLIQLGTNMLKNTDYIADVFNSGLKDIYQNFVQPCVNISEGRIIEARVLENNSGLVVHGFGTPQDAVGLSNFNIRTSTSYRVYQRTVTQQARTRSYIDELSNTVVATGAPQAVITLTALTAAKVLAGIHNVYVGELLALKYFGDESRGSQDDPHVEFVDTKLTLTPEGLILTFTEQVRGDIAAISSGDPWYRYGATYATRYFFNPATGTFDFKHAIRFRKHGFGFSQFGKANAYFYTPIHGRATARGFTQEVSGPGGADFGFPAQSAAETNIKFLRQVLVEEMAGVGVGGRFFKEGQAWMIDNAVPYARFAKSVIGGGYTNYFALRSIFTTGNPNVISRSNVGGAGFRVLTFLPLEAPHYNGLAMAVNQLKTGRVLDYRGLQFVYGPKVLGFDAGGFDPQGKFAVLQPWQNGFGATPAPMNAFVCLIGDATTTAPYYQSWFASKGFPFRSTNGLPAELEDFKTESNEYRDALADGSISCSGAAVTMEAISGAWHKVYRANCLLRVDDPYLSQAAPFNTGLATVAIPNGAANINLNTAWNSVRWLSTDDFKALCGQIGVPFLFQETIVPLRLDTLELPGELEVSEAVTSVRSASRTVIVGTVNQFTGSSQPAPPLGDNSATLSGINAITNTAPLKAYRRQELTGGVTKLLAWRLAEPSDIIEAPEALWKTAPQTGAPLAFSADGNRTIGTGLVNRVLSNNGFQGIFGIQVFGSVNMFSNPMSGSVGAPNTTLDGVGSWRGVFGANPRHIPPWWPIDNGGLILADGPRIFSTFKTPASDEAKLKAERYFRYLARETLWFSCYMVTNRAELEPYQEYAAVPQPHWGAVKDWWQQGENYLMSSFLNYAGPAPRDIPSTGETELVTAGPGVTLLLPPSASAGLDGARRWLYDPVYLSVVL